MKTAARTTYKFGDVEYDFARRTYVMGILNVTPDSFSDGGHFYDPEEAVRHGLEMIEEGADFLDIGGESTRPGSEMVTAEEELRRVLPVVTRLAKLTSVPISIDTYKSAVAEQALEAGAVIVNDISGLRFDASMAETIARHQASAVIMHIKGTPKTMQADPSYEDVVQEICETLRSGIGVAEVAGIHQLMIDPGIGFGKTRDHNLEILRRLDEFHSLGYPVLVGPSRKSFIGTVLDLPVEQRVEGTAAAVAVSVMKGASVVRVHDVQAMTRVVRMADAILRSQEAAGR